MDRALRVSVTPSPSAAEAAARGANGRNPLLSPSGKQILHDFLGGDDDDASSSNGAATNGSSREQSATTATPTQRAALARDMSSARALSRSCVQIQVNTRPFCLKLVEADSEMVVSGFVPDVRSGASKGVIERSGLVLPGDVLVAVNGESDGLASTQTTVDALTGAELPVVLTFRRLPVLKATLGEYTVADIARNLTLRGSALLDTRSAKDAALLVKAMVEALESTRATTPLATFISRVERRLQLQPSDASGLLDARQMHVERIQQLVQSVHKVVEAQQKEELRQWNAVKSSNFKRIDVMSKQRAGIEKKLESMRANPELVNPENHAVWQEYVELRHLSHQMRSSVEKAKREHFLPDLEDYALRVGNDGVYIGVGDIWIPSFHAKFTLETRSSAPHLFFHLSTPATHGLKLRAKNFTVSTEGLLPRFHCDELNIEAQLIADVPLVYDAITGWSVPPDELHVKLMSLMYYERQANSVKRGQNHDTVMKMLINRLLPVLVRHAAQNLLCGELGPLLEKRDAQLLLSGEIKVKGKKLALYDAALHPGDLSDGSKASAKEQALAEEARELMGISRDEALTLYRVFRTLSELAPTKKKAFAFSPITEPKRLSIRSLQNYFEQFKAFPHLRALVLELWSQAMELLSPRGSSRRAVESSHSSHSGSFAALIENMGLLSEYPVDVSVTLQDMTFRLDLAEGAATYYTTLQRILRQEMDSVSVGMSNLDSMRDGTFLEHKLAELDEQYEKISRVLGFVATNVDDLGAVFRGGIPAGFRSNMFLEVNDVACKGPCGGSFIIPLTDLAKLRSGQLDVTSEKRDAVSTNEKRGKPSATALTHEDGALVFSKFFLHQLRQSSNDTGGAADGEPSPTSALDKEASSSDDDAVDEIDDNDLPSDRLQVRVKNTATRVLFELPSDLSRLETSSFVPFAFELLTDEDDEPPRLRIETGEFAKCQYKAEQIAVSGNAWQFVKRTKESAGRVLQSPSDSDQQPQRGGSRNDADSSVESEPRSAWEDYAESPFLRLKFEFFTSCQITPEHMFWSIKSATLAEPMIAQVKHRVCLVQLLQEVGMLSIKNSQERAARREKSAHLRRTLHQRRGAGSGALDKRESRRTSFSSVVSDRETVASRETNDDYDHLSESMHSADADSFEQLGDSEFAFSGIQAFEEENSGDEDDSDDSDDSDGSDDDDDDDDAAGDGDDDDDESGRRENRDSSHEDEKEDDSDGADEFDASRSIQPSEATRAPTSEPLARAASASVRTGITKQASVFF
ncbi:hypothetical protein PybrP1_011494 [[Pythium] brassicae (nom. inval.)]|nr:hypothetical protein PybrP1_011494 [[Pythium] brassicae (nom. inval.)]